MSRIVSYVNIPAWARSGDVVVFSVRYEHYPSRVLRKRDRTMDNAQRCDGYINIPSSKPKYFIKLLGS
jgi:hypothetical protein